MSSEAPRDQLASRPEHHSNAARELSAYIDKIEASPRKRLALLTSNEHPRQRLDTDKPTELREEIASLVRMKQDVPVDYKR